MPAAPPGQALPPTVARAQNAALSWLIVAVLTHDRQDVQKLAGGAWCCSRSSTRLGAV